MTKDSKHRQQNVFKGGFFRHNHNPKSSSALISRVTVDVAVNKIRMEDQHRLARTNKPTEPKQPTKNCKKMKPLNRKQLRHCERKDDKIGAMPARVGCLQKPLECGGISYTASSALCDLEVVGAGGKGFAHWYTHKNEVSLAFLKVPKNAHGQHHTTALQDDVVETLEEVQKIEPDCKRGANQHGYSECGARYTNVGTKCRQGKGYSKSVTFAETGSHSWQQIVRRRLLKLKIQKWAKRVTGTATEFLPSSWLRALREALSGTGADQRALDKGVFAACVASTVDYSAPSHVDDDFFLSFHQINVKGRYGDAEIVHYFCFPSLRVAVPLCPGDILIFNPHVHHCLSSKTSAYSQDRVHVSTFYVKTRHISGNDTDAPIPHKVLDWLDLELPGVAK